MARCPQPVALAAANELPRLRVVAGALLDGAGRVLIADRPPGKVMAGRWEFPGGKVGTGERLADALKREFAEELGVEVLAADECMTLTHDYTDRRVELSMWIIERFAGEPRGLEGQRVKWVDVAQLDREDMLEADRPFIEALKSRSVHGFSPTRREGGRADA